MISSGKPGFSRYQLVIWLLVYLLFILYLYQRIREFPYVVGIATSAFVSFAIIIYCYSLLLYPLLYKRIGPVLFGISVLLFVAGISFLRMYVEHTFISRLFTGRSFFTAGNAHFSYVLITNFMALLFGIC